MPFSLFILQKSRVPINLSTLLILGNKADLHTILSLTIEWQYIEKFRKNYNFQELSFYHLKDEFLWYINNNYYLTNRICTNVSPSIINFYFHCRDISLYFF